MAIIKRRILMGPDAEADATSISELFHENTKLHPGVPLGGSIPTAYSQLEDDAMTSVGRCYPRAPQIALTPPSEMPALSQPLETVISRRRTVRSFAAVPMAEAVLSKLLFLTGGVTARRTTSLGQTRELRAVPSAGALYPIEIYLAVRRVQGVPQGVYHFSPRAHILEKLVPGDPTPALSRACHYRESMEEAAIVIVFAGVFERTKRKYGERGYRYVLLEAGHTAQNLVLAGAALGVGCMNVCGFYDERLNDLFSLDGIEESALYVAYAGLQGGQQGPGEPGDERA
jgi:SagB-type dehydrogenase family enzyme